MKLALVTLLTLFGLSVTAAELKPIGKVSNKGIQTVEVTFEKLKTWDPGGSSYFFAKNFTSYTVTNQEETLDNTVQQLIYKTYSDRWSRPEQAGAFLIKRTAESYAKIAVLALRNSDLSDDQKALLGNDVAALLKYKTVDLYETGHGNSFGDCSGFALLDKRDGEIALFETCYTE